MSLKDLTLEEELEEYEQELQENGAKNNYGYYAKLVNVYEEMYKRLILLARTNKKMYEYLCSCGIFG